MRHQGIDTRDMLEPHRTADNPDDDTAREDSRKRLQANITKTLDKKENYDPHYRIRKKLARWKLNGTPRAQADRFQRYLGLIRGRVPPG